MRLYVHFEPQDEALAWTKRLRLPPVEEASASPSVYSVLRCFFAAYSAKFRPQPPPELETLDVFVEFNQNAASRRRVSCLDVSVAAAGKTGASSLRSRQETCNFELVVVPREPQRKVLGPEPPPALKAAKKCSIHQETNEKDVRDPQLRMVLELAANHMKLKRFRASREVYRDVVKNEPRNPEALLGLGDILVASGRHEEAVDRYFKECWKAHGGPECVGKGHARLAFTSALRLAECYIEMRRFEDAVEVLDELQTFIRANSGGGGGDGEKSKAFFSDAKERLWMEEQMDVLKATALYATKHPDNEEKAILLVMHLLPDLQVPTLNLDALLLYARIANDRGKKSEALSLALRVLVGKSHDQAVKTTVVSLLKEVGSMERLQDAVPPCNPSAGAAYAFIATILKDFGALEKSIVCFQQAQISDSQSASYALNHAHALEACCRYAEAYDVLASFFRRNPTLKVGSGVATLEARTFAEILDHGNAWSSNNKDKPASVDNIPGKGNESYQWRIEWMSEHAGYANVIPPASESGSSVKVGPLSLHTLQINKKKSSSLTEVELDLLACFFTVVKILFVSGRMSVLLPLIRLLEPLRFGRELHRTTIRNEQAYYACIAQLLSIEEALQLFPASPPSETRTDVIYICGDSHALATAWREINVQGQSTLLRPTLVTGLKHWHLRKESTFYPKLNFWRAVASIPRKSRVIFLFGEIDCREGILDAVEKCKYETIEQGMEHTIGIFMEALEDVVRKFDFDVYIHPVVPVLDETRSLVVLYNKLFQECVITSSICKWLDFFDDLVYETPSKLRPDFVLDGTHLHPSYLTKLEAALNKHTQVKSRAIIT